MIKKIIILIYLLLLLHIAYAIDFSPQGDIFGKNRYDIYGFIDINGTNFTASGDFCISGGNCLSTASGDITAVTTSASSGLQGGATSGAVDLSINFTLVNATIDARDSDTTYSAGNGLNLSSTTFLVNAATCSSGEISKYNGTKFNCVTDTGTTYTSGDSYIVIAGTVITFNLTAADNRFLQSESDPFWVGNSSSVARIGDCPSGQVVMNITTGGVECVTVTSSVTPGGSDTYLQFNDNGSFGGIGNLTYVKSTNTFSVGNADGTGINGRYYGDNRFYRGDGSELLRFNGAAAVIDINPSNGGIGILRVRGDTQNQLIESDPANDCIIMGGASDCDGGSQVEIEPVTTTDIGLEIRGAVSQSGNLLEFQNSSSSQRSYFDPDGDLTVGVGGFGGTTDPALAFGDGDTGFYEGSDDVLRLTVGTSNRYTFRNTVFDGSTNTFSIDVSTAASDTNPTFSFKGDEDTGLGKSDSDILTLIAGGAGIVNVSASGINVTSGTDVCIQGGNCLSSVSGGNATPGGSDTQVQFNDGGSFNGDTGLVWDKTNNYLTLSGTGSKLILPSMPSGATPQLAFGDADTGFYEGADDTLYAKIGGSVDWQWASSYYSSSTSNGASLRSSAATGTIPGLTFKDDEDTGVGIAAGDQLSLIAGGVQIAQVKESTNDQFIVSPGATLGAASAPALAFGDGDTGIYESSDDNMDFILGGLNRWDAAVGYFQAPCTNCVRLKDNAMSVALPGFTSVSDTNTGMVILGSDTLDLVTGGVSAIDIDASQNVNISSGNLNVEGNITGFPAWTGWADYTDTQYNSTSTFSITGSTDTIIPNNNGTIVDSQKPLDITEFYNGSHILGKSGDGYGITVEMKCKPTAAGTTRVDFWFDIGGAVGELYRRTISLNKGNGVEHDCTFSTNVYTLDTWESNGALVYANANDNLDVYDIRYVIHRLHKAR